MAAITPPTVKINTFVKTNSNQIDIISKVFFLFEFLLGLNRVPVLYVRPMFAKLTLILTILSNFYLFSYYSEDDSEEYSFKIKTTQTLFCCIFGFLTWKRLRSYYDELANFDKKISQKPKIDSEPFIIGFQMIVILGVTIYILIRAEMYRIIPVYIIHIFEYNYYGYLFYLLIQRLRLINKCLASSNLKKKDTKVVHLSMKKLNDLYHVIIKVYYLLIDAIKWQFLGTLVITFIYLLLKSYYIARIYINLSKPFMDTVDDIVLVLTEIVPLLSPCMCCDILRSEVRHLRELLASKLYENNLDKSSRSITRALLALTETRNLSFSLLRMVDISISLPFTLMGLLVTYLIIMLQFEKVITPHS